MFTLVAALILSSRVTKITLDILTFPPRHLDALRQVESGIVYSPHFVSQKFSRYRLDEKLSAIQGVISNAACYTEAKCRKAAYCRATVTDGKHRLKLSPYNHDGPWETHFYMARP